MTEATTNDPTGSTPRRIIMPETTETWTELTLEPALTEVIALARAGNWSGAERALHDCFRTVPPAALPHTYIAAVALVSRLLTATPAATRCNAAPPIAAAPRRPAPTPRLLTFRDPALDYAHAVLTALRGRLAVRATAVRQAG